MGFLRDERRLNDNDGMNFLFSCVSLLFYVIYPIKKTQRHPLIMYSYQDFFLFSPVYLIFLYSVHILN